MYKVGDRLRCLRWLGGTFKEGDVVEIESISAGGFSPQYFVKDGRFFAEGTGVWEYLSITDPLIDAALKKYNLELDEEFIYDGDTFRFTESGLEFVSGEDWLLDDSVNFNELLSMDITKAPFIPNEYTGDVYVIDPFFEEGYYKINTSGEWEEIELALSRGVVFYKTKEDAIEKVEELGW